MVEACPAQAGPRAGRGRLRAASGRPARGARGRAQLVAAARASACGSSARTASGSSTPTPRCGSTPAWRRWSRARPGRVLRPVRLARRRAAGAGPQPQPRAVHVRLRRQPGRRQRQRPAPVLGHRPGDRGGPAAPGELRQPAQVRPPGAQRRPDQAGGRREERPAREGTAPGLAGTSVAVPGAVGGGAVRLGRRDPGRDRGADVRRRHAAGPPAAAGGATGWRSSATPPPSACWSPTPSSTGGCSWRARPGRHRRSGTTRGLPRRPAGGRRRRRRGRRRRGLPAPAHGRLEGVRPGAARVAQGRRSPSWRASCPPRASRRARRPRRDGMPARGLGARRTPRPSGR